MCKYCENNKEIIHNENGSVGIYSNILDFDCDDDTYNQEIEINYCPICGRKLVEEE